MTSSISPQVTVSTVSKGKSTGTTMTQTTDLPTVYWSLWHPHKTWLDIFVGFIVSFFLPAFKLKQRDAGVVRSLQQLKDDRLQHALSLRKGMNQVMEGSVNNKSGGFFKWATVMGCRIVEAKVVIPRKDSIFHDWKIINPTDASIIDTSVYPADSNITLFVAFPVTILPDSVTAPTEVNNYGCLILECNEILTILPKSVPVVVFFHGGGLTIGTPRLGERVDLICEGLELSDGAKIDPLIYVSVQYSLAPEHPFPVAPLEACSVISYLLDLGYELQISGVSAGGYLALVAGLEVYRIHPNKVQICSILAMCPMLTPSTDTISFYQNQSSSHSCPVHFLRFSYRSYLNLPESIDQKNGKNEQDLYSLIGTNSTRVEWSQSKWYTSSLRRIVEPYIDVPGTLGSDKDAPTFIVTTNLADPLHDGAIVMIEALKAVGASVTHHDDRGSHWIGTKLDPIAYRKLAMAARDSMVRQ
jgi:acetyl esterase/lipase